MAQFGIDTVWQPVPNAGRRLVVAKPGKPSTEVHSCLPGVTRLSQACRCCCVSSCVLLEQANTQRQTAAVWKSQCWQGKVLTQGVAACRAANAAGTGRRLFGGAGSCAPGQLSTDLILLLILVSPAVRTADQPNALHHAPMTPSNLDCRASHACRPSQTAVLLLCHET